MDPNKKLLKDEGELFENPENPCRYCWLVGKLNYLMITRPCISYAVSIVSRFLEAPRLLHCDAVIHIVRYIKIEVSLIKIGQFSLKQKIYMVLYVLRG